MQRKDGKPKRKPIPHSKAGILLRDMRHVYHTEERYDVTPGQGKCRQYMHDDLKGFMQTMARLEQAHQERDVRAAELGLATQEKDVRGSDVNTERTRELINELLERATKASKE